MKEIISFYDDFIIYHPNYFFSSIFLIITLLLIFLVATISQFPIKKSRKKISRIKINYSSIKTIFFNAPNSVGFFIGNIITKLVVPHIIIIHKLLILCINKINKLAVFIDLKVEKKIKKIAKAIIIDE